MNVNGEADAGGNDRGGHKRSAEEVSEEVSGPPGGFPKKTLSGKRNRVMKVHLPTLPPGTDFCDLKESQALTAAQLKHAGRAAAELSSAFTLPELVEGGFSTGELLQAGAEIAALKGAGVKAKDMKDAGVGATALKDAYTLEELVVGFEAAELLLAGFDIPSLKGAGVTAKDMKDAGVAGSSLKTNGYAIQDLLDGGLSLSEVYTALAQGRWNFDRGPQRCWRWLW